MPRRKQSRMPSRAQPTRVHDAIKEPDMETEQRCEKVRLLLADFDHEVKRRVRIMEDEIEANLQSIRQMYWTDLMRYPAATRNLPWNGGVEKSSAIRNSMANVMTSADNILQSVAKKRGRKPKALLLAERNTELAATPSVSCSTRSTRQRTVLGSSQSDNFLPPPTTARAQRSKKVNIEATPINQGVPVSYSSSLLVTPKFDPRNPLPPGTIKRKPNAGEVAISLEGSPLQVSPIGNLKVRMEGLMNTLDMEKNMDEETKDMLLNLREKVNKLSNM